jgi:hypothetical protein
MRAKGIIAIFLAWSVLAGGARVALGAESPEAQQDEIGRTPPRLSFVDGQVSFWRPGAQDWVQAQVNTPLAPGDELYTGSPGNIELQIGARAFVRGWANTQVGLENQEPDFLQFKVTAGRASFDIRSIDPGRTVEVDTPNAAFTIEHAGYYRVNVDGDRTSFIARRGGRATVTPAQGQAAAIAASEEVVIEGTESPQVSSFAAPRLDEWDRWNYARTDALLDAVSARYVSPGTYGVDDLDQHGAWRVVPEYGSVWVPTGVPTGWAPYTTGSWVLDPFYGWTWVDTAPWGWAPYHYGRWVFVNGFWGWAPGPVVVRPAYAPALVAFFGGPGVGVSVSVGGPLVGWVALGWGEPCVPWWGRPGFVRRPWWGGWGGPRVVNNVVISRTTVVNVEHIHVYRNIHARNAVVAVHEDRFGHGHIRSARVAQVDVNRLRPTHAAPRVSATPAHFVPTATRGIRPPEESMRRSVVATRPPHRERESEPRGERRDPAGVSRPAPRIVTAPPKGEPASVMSRPPFGQSPVERPPADRRPSPPRQRQDGPRGPERGPERPPSVAREAPAQPQSPPQAKPAPATPPSQVGRPETSLPQARPGASPQPPAQRPEVSRPPADQGQPKAPPRQDGPRGPERPPSVAREAPAQPQPAPQAKPAPATPPSQAGRSETSPPPQARREATPQPPASRPEVSRPPADQGQPKAGPGRPERGPESRPSVAREAPVQPQSAPQAKPAPATPPSPAGRPQASPPPQARREAAPQPPARPLPGEPANRLAPNRAPEMKSSRQAERESPKPEGRSGGRPDKGQRERQGG